MADHVSLGQKPEQDGSPETKLQARLG